jgi:hypothetical protein
MRETAVGSMISGGVCCRGHTYTRDCVSPCDTLARWREQRLLELAPVAWTHTRERDDVRQLLDAPFRRLTRDAGL